MEKLLTVLLALGVVATVSAGAAPQSRTQAREADISGKWALTISGGAHDDMVMGLVLKHDGEKLTGTLATPHGEAGLTGRFSQNALELETTAPDDHTPRVVLKGKLMEDGTLSGYMSGERGDATWSAVRDRDKK